MGRTCDRHRRGGVTASSISYLIGCKQAAHRKIFQIATTPRRWRTIIKGRIYTNGGEREREKEPPLLLPVTCSWIFKRSEQFSAASLPLLYHHIKQYDRVRRRSYLHYWLRTPISSDEKTHLSAHLNNKKATTPLRRTHPHIYTHTSLFAFDINQSSAQENKLKKVRRKCWLQSE